MPSDCGVRIRFSCLVHVIAIDLPSRGEVKGAVCLRACSGRLSISELGQAWSKREVLVQEILAVLEAFYAVYQAHHTDPDWLSCARMGHGYRLQRCTSSAAIVFTCTSLELCKLYDKSLVIYEYLTFP